ncbi:hypothetical protein N7456_011703 [Penicillium angulare]|uniref:Major facilitator superfamily (MFS) profile domain-containing protein n=1 Tax=Penicillium angulare TaxID=116970 RepID=A0A9W9EU72_9EURO|nr:hypothetical protein N7456_011703 [Penicillium angulare]
MDIQISKQRSTSQTEISDIESDEEKRLVRRLDIVLMPTLWVLYLLSYADRTNIGNAKVAGMDQDLGLSSDQYSLALVVFFISYIIFEIPSNLLLSRTRPSIFLPIIMVSWGVVTCLMSLVQTPGALYAVRVVVGLFESGFAPGVLLLLSSWYRPAEQARRFSLFYSAAVLSGAFGAVVAGAIMDSLDGAYGIAGWRWLFIVEGATTIAAAIIAAFILPDFPSTTKRFSARERQIAVERLARDNLNVHSEGQSPLSSIKAIQQSLKNWRTWLLAVGYTTIGGSASMSYFYPTLVAGLGYEGDMAQYMVVPIYAVAFVTVLGVGFLNDKIPNHRGLVIAIMMTLATICSIIICAVYNYTARYVLLIFMASGLLASNASSLAYSSSTFASMDQETRGVSLAFVNAIGNLALIYGAYLFPSEDSPKFLRGFGVISALGAVGAVIYLSAHISIRKYA